MSVASVKKSEANVLVSTYERYPVLMKRGRGVLPLRFGRQALSRFPQWDRRECIGYSHPAITKALTQQSRKLIHTSNLFFHDYQVNLRNSWRKSPD